MQRERHPFVYIMASGANATLYVGVISDLPRRITEHRERRPGSFTAQYGVTRLVWYEPAETMEAAITTEKRIKRWRREYKMNLIERDNPHWEDLAVGLGFPPLR